MIGYVNIGVILALFIGTSLTYASDLSVTEEQDAGTSVGNVDGVNDDYTLTPTPYFRLSGSLLSTKVRIDRESLSSDVIRLTAVPMTAGKAPVEIEVTVLDINDNNPVFPEPVLHMNLPETTSLQSKHILPFAVDSDAGVNAQIQSYEIVSGDTDRFELSLESSLFLKLKKPIDREERSRYDLNISATDGGSPARKGYVHVIVSVLDVNDNDPKFTEEEYNFEVPEDMTVGEKLFTVKAEDEDAGSNGIISYVLVSQPVPGTFVVNSTTGDITLEKELDHETRRTHTLVVSATDGGVPSMTDDALVHVTVIDVNDNDPVINFRFLSPASVASIDEHESIGAIVAVVTVSDADSTWANNPVAMGIAEGNELEFFELTNIANTAGAIKIVNNQSLNAQPFYNLTVRVHDADTDSERFALASIIIVVNSGENHPPVFDQSHYEVTMSETVPVGSVVVHVQAADDDAGLNGRLVYSISGGNSRGWFLIDKSTGLITTTSSLHFEQTAANGTVTLDIVAKDETKKALSDEATLVIRIRDENDNAPVFAMPRYYFNVTENRVNAIGEIIATDDDYGVNGDVFYGMESCQCIGDVHMTRDTEPFEIRADGLIKTTAPLDREFCAEYSVQAWATDSGSPPLKTTVEILVKVIDVNDNPPVTYPSRYFTVIKPDTPVGEVVDHVSASDLDIFDLNRLTYSMVSTSRFFRVAENTGAVSLSRSVAGRNGANRTLEIVARDSSGQVSNTAFVTVLIRTAVNTAASFTKAAYEYYIQEDVGDGYPVGVVELENRFGLDATFYITEGNPDSAFRIEEFSGMLYVENSTMLDAEISMVRNLTIVAELRDAGTHNGVGYITTRCTVRIVDVNDNFPYFVSLPQTASKSGDNSYEDAISVILSGNFERKFIYNAKAGDDDVTSRDRDVMYEVRSSFPGFEIDPTTGVLYHTLVHALDGGHNNLTTQLEISACDMMGIQKCAKLLLGVTLVLVDNIISQPAENIYTALPESAPVGSPIGLVPELSGLADSFAVSHDLISDTPFRVYPRGEIIISDDLDYEKLTGYQLAVTTNVKTHDKEYRKRSWLTMAVEDVNDNSPTPTQSEFQFAIKESALPGDHVGTVRAYDLDSGIHGAVVYEIPKMANRYETDLFYCDAFTGDIYLTQRPDRNLLQLLNLRSGEIDLNIVASDQNGVNSTLSEVRKSVLTAQISMQFDNRYPMYFKTNTYYVEVMENLHISDIITVQTMDMDELWVTNPPMVHYGLQVAGTGEEPEYFRIGKDTGIVGMRNSVQLDREESEFHHLIVRAKYADGTEEATSNLYIRVLDEKDAPPVFTADSYRFQIREKSLTRAPIGRVEARDGDVTTERTRISYRFNSETRERFEIDENSGFLFLSRPLDYSEGSEYNLIIAAIDESGAESEVSVVINVEKTTQAIPRIVYNAFKNLKEGYYSDGTIVATPGIAESYTGTPLTYSIISPSGIQRSGMPSYHINSVTGAITVTGTVDREVSDQLKLTVRVSDGTSQFNDIPVDVKVNDVNDNAPFFTSPSSYKFRLESASRAGEAIGRVVARDKDTGRNGLVSVSLANPADSKFMLDGDGYLLVRSPLDVTTVLHAVDIIATDKGTPPKSTRTTVYVLLYYEIVQAKSASPKVHLSETAGDSVRVTTISGGLEKSGSARFYLGDVTGGPPDYRDANTLFSVEAKTGAVVTKSALDNLHGTYRLEVFTVEEVSQGRRARISSRTITVEVSDENNNPPEFPEGLARASVSESKPPGTKVTTVKATDLDSGDVLTYSLSSKSGDLGSDFVIDPVEAVVSVGPSGVDRERKSQYLLEVTADDGTHRSAMELQIDIEDVNDEAPQFTSTPICFDLPENSPYGTVVGHLETEDRDLESYVEYSIIGDNEMHTNYTIHANHGTIRYTGTGGLDRELQDLHVLQVRAIDQGGLHSIARVYIYITDENDHQPMLHVQGHDIIEISEESHINSVVARVHGTDLDLGDNQEIYYSIVSGNPYGHFRIGTFSGMVHVNSKLDRETIGQYRLTIMGRNKFAGLGFEQFSNLTLDISLLDENDNTPYFTTPLITYLPENAPVGHTVVDIKAVDPDEELDGVVSYRLLSQSPNDGTFSLDSQSGLLTVSDNRNLDFETTTQYNLTIEAKDGGYPASTSKGKIEVRIVDANDNRPVFEKSQYTATLREDSPVGSHIVRVAAEDDDTGHNSEIQYRIVPSLNASFFHIERYTGRVTLFNTLDFEKKEYISVEIEAIDGGVNQLSSRCTLLLNVEDVNDWSPIISPDHIILHVQENSQAQSLAKFTAIDNDNGNNGVANIYGIQSVPHSDSFSLNIGVDGSASLTVNKALDRELVKEYQLTIKARDRGSPPRTGVATLLVIVDDRNEYPPEFDQIQYFSSVREDVSLGSFVTSVKATDGDGSQIRYELQDNENIPFYINHDDGKIYVRASLDREVTGHYNVTVVAYDEEDVTGLQYHDNVTLAIDVLDVNDNTPVFTRGNTDFFVDSSISSGTVQVVEAMDPDFGDNGRITYSIVSGDGIFSIDSQTGEIIISSAMSSGPYNLTIQGADNGAHPKSAVAQIRLFLHNERQPVISHDLSSTAIDLVEGLRSNEDIGTFKATGNVEFQLIGDRYGWFAINPTTGHLTVSGNVDRELTSTLTLWVVVTETGSPGSPSFSGFQKLTVKISDVNDNRPMFNDAVYEVHVREGEKGDIASFSVNDMDEGQNAEFSLSIVDVNDDADSFSLSSDGKLRIVEGFDREKQPSYKLVIRATDRGTPALHTDLVFRVIVDDVNEHEPKFERLLSANIPEDLSVGVAVLKVSSVDDDEKSNHTYRLTDNPGGYFDINDEGYITVAKPLDRENISTHALEVEAFDGTWTKPASVTIRLSDANDNAPRFTENTYATSISVDTEKGAAVLSVNATDADIGDNGKINYRISGGSLYFDIDDTGLITIRQVLVCSAEGCPAKHSLSVVACDGGLRSVQCSSANVFITVKSVNEHTPQFIGGNVEIAVMGSTPVNAKIYELWATDPDPDTILTFAIMPGRNGDYFSIANENQLVLEKSLSSFGQGHKLTVDVMVSDDGVPMKSALRELMFEVTGENENSPRFLRESYSSTPVPENSDVGFEVIAVQALDSDYGVNGWVKYEIVGGNDEKKFGIDDSGVITLLDTLDFETRKSYELIVQASDYAVNSKKTTVPVIVTVEDVNDNVPHFNASEYEIRVFENTPIGDTVSRILAIDEDFGENAEVLYSMQYPSVIGVRQNGELYASSVLDYENQTLHIAQILVSNAGITGSNRAQIDISVLARNEYRPVFTPATRDFTISHLSGFGSLVGLVSATDRDDDVDGIVEYLMIPNNDSRYFHLGRRSGKLIVLDASPYEVGDKITIDIIAKNPTTSAEFCLFDETTVTIQVISNECHKEPCKNGATCEDGPARFICYCLPGFTGIDCGANIDDCKANPCGDHGTCSDQVDDYKCTCEPGYTGRNCDVRIDFCESSPCLNGGICTSLETNFSCECPFGAEGDRCETQSLNFPPQSYIKLPAFTSSISFEFSTVYPNSLLFYSDLTLSAYVALEILDGKIQLKVQQSGSSEISVLNLNTVVNDGAWHTVAVNIVDRKLSLVLDSCTSGVDNQCADTLNLNSVSNVISSDLIVGGILEIDVIENGKLSSHDFVGCMRSLTFDTNAIASSLSPYILRKHLIRDGCDKTTSLSACSSASCQNGAGCVGAWTQAICTCTDGWQGPDCDIKLTGHTFSGEGYASISFKESYYRDVLLETSRNTAISKRSIGNTESSVEIRFRTTENSAMLFAAIATDKDNFGTLYVSDNLLHYSHIGSDGLVTLFSTKEISDGLWHDAKITLTGSGSENVEAVLRIDGEVPVSNGKQTFPVSNRDGSVRITDFENPLQVQHIYIGGTPLNVARNAPQVPSFIGCFFHFKLNGVRQQLRSDVPNQFLSFSIDDSAISQSCEGFGLCDSVICENGRVCVSNTETVTQCVCPDGHTDDGSGCVPAAAGFSWWIIVIAVALMGAVGAGLAFFVYRRKKARSETVEQRSEFSSVEYDVSSIANSSAPEAGHQPAIEVVTDDNSEKPMITVSSCDESSTHGFSSQVTLIPTANSATKNGRLYTNARPDQHSTTDPSGRISACDIRLNENFDRPAQRPASAQANLVPEVLYPTVDRTNAYTTSASRTLPRKTPNKNMSYTKDHTDTNPRRPGSRIRNPSGSQSAIERKRQKARLRDNENIEMMLKELHGFAGLTKEESEVVALTPDMFSQQKNLSHLLREDTSSLSSSSVANSETSRRSRNALRSASPRKEIYARNTTPSPASFTQMPTLDPKSAYLPERYVSLSPFNYPSVCMDSDTEDPNSTSPDDDTSVSVTSDETTVSKHGTCSSLSSSSTSGFSENNHIDLNFPSNSMEYFTSLTGVFDDLARLKSDDTRIIFPPDDQSKHRSGLPRLDSDQISSLWSVIEELSNRPARRHDTPLYPSTHDGDRKTASRVNSPATYGVIDEELPRSGRVRSPVDLLDSHGLEGDRKRHNISRSSSGRSNRSLKTKVEFVNFV